jgi:hypothetical protein
MSPGSEPSLTPNRSPSITTAPAAMHTKPIRISHRPTPPFSHQVGRVPLDPRSREEQAPSSRARLTRASAADLGVRPTMLSHCPAPIIVAEAPLNL